MIVNSRTIRSLFLLLGIVTFISACEIDEEKISRDGDLKLTYEVDTVKFDTLLTSVGSISEYFRISNPHKNAIEITDIYLGKGNNSEYSITVYGKEGKSFKNEVIFGHDSLLVLVKVLIDPTDQDLAFLVKDSIVVEYNGNQDDVKLVAWGQDAYYFDREVIECDAIWKQGKPYVLMDTVLVSKGCSLTVEAGTRIYLDNNSALAVAGTLKVNGTAKNKVIIRNSRKDREIAPGQWNSIVFAVSSKDNLIDHAVIKNGTVGIYIGSPDDDDVYDLKISNTSIGHMSKAGLFTVSSDLYVQNVEIFDCMELLVGNTLGGNCKYEQCTFSNLGTSFSRDQAYVYFSDMYLDLPPVDLKVDMSNCIIWGGQDEELVIKLSKTANVEIILSNNIIKSKAKQWLPGNILSEEPNFPKFHRPEYPYFDYQIDSLSPARDKALNSTAVYDIIGTLRDAKPDIGAYERKDSIK